MGLKRQYTLKVPRKGTLKGKFTTHICLTCGKEFRRRLYGHSSKEYCTYRCEPPKINDKQEFARKVLQIVEQGIYTTRDFQNAYETFLKEILSEVEQLCQEQLKETHNNERGI